MLGVTAEFGLCFSPSPSHGSSIPPHPSHSPGVELEPPGMMASSGAEIQGWNNLAAVFSSQLLLGWGQRPSVSSGQELFPHQEPPRCFCFWFKALFAHPLLC